MKPTCATLAVLFAAACGSSARPEPGAPDPGMPDSGTPEPVRTYRIRRLADSPEARSSHLASSLADGSALVMGGNTSEAINVHDIDTTQRFDPVLETFTAGPQLAFSVRDREFTVPVALRDGAFLLVGGGINSGTVLRTPSPR